jgi:hypothetical protein
MSEFEKELAYVKQVLSKVLTPDDLFNAKNLKTSFITKYTVLISPTDKKFLRILDTLTKLENEATKRLTSNYYF